MHNAAQQWEEIERTKGSESALEYYKACIRLMDAELLEILLTILRPRTTKELLHLYCDRHLQKFGEDFIVDLTEAAV